MISGFIHLISAGFFNVELFLDLMLQDVGVGGTVVTIVATDTDSGSNAVITYSLVGGSTPFAINANTGVITTTATLDRETTSEYQVHLIQRTVQSNSFQSESRPI